VLLTSYGLDKNTTCTETVPLKYMQTRVYWNPCIYGYTDSHSCLCERTL